VTFEEAVKPEEEVKPEEGENLTEVEKIGVGVRYAGHKPS
jgi:hypothetical protein